MYLLSRCFDDILQKPEQFETFKEAQIVMRREVAEQIRGINAPPLSDEQMEDFIQDCGDDTYRVRETSAWTDTYYPCEWRIDKF